TVFRRAQLALVGWIAHKGNLREDRGHIRADEHNKGRLLHSTVFDSRTLRCLACMKRLLYVGGELARFIDLVLERDLLHQVLQLVEGGLGHRLLTSRYFKGLWR